MHTQMLAPQCWKGRTVGVTHVDPETLEKQIREAVARRAYEIFERRGAAPGHETEDWKKAESEIVRSLGCAFTILNNKVSLNTDCSVFNEGVMEVCVEPRRLTICGRPSDALRTHCADLAANFIYEVLNLPVEVDSSRFESKFNGCILEIDLYRIPPAGGAASRTSKAA